MGLESGIWDPGSEIRKKIYSGSRIRVQGLKRHRILDPESGSATPQMTHKIETYFIFKF
jgi:hypothetical protein